MRYIVYRHGSNAANQPVIVGTWKARTRLGAIAYASGSVVVDHNQYLTAKLWSRATQSEKLAASTADYANELELREIAQKLWVIIRPATAAELCTCESGDCEQHPRHIKL